MKKLAVIMLIALIAMFSVFAGTTLQPEADGSESLKSDGSVLGSTEVTTKLTLSVSDAKLAGFRVGITSDNLASTGEAFLNSSKINLDDKVPSAAKTIALGEIDSATAVAKTASDSYLYYKFKSANSLKISLAANRLHDETGKYINYTVKMGTGVGSNTKAAADLKVNSDTPTPWTVTIAPQSSYAIGYFPFSIVTDTIAVGAEADYTATLKLAVQTV